MGLMRGAWVVLALTCGAVGCRDVESPPIPTALTPGLVRGLWKFTRTGPSACVPDTLYVRLTTAFFLPGHTDRITVSGDWTSNRDAQVRTFTGGISVGGAFQWELTLTEGVQGTMDLRDRASGSAYCADGSTAPVAGVRSLPASP